LDLSFRDFRIDQRYRQEYSIESLSDTQRAMLEDLRDYGLMWQRRVKRLLRLMSRNVDANCAGFISSF
jgi:hypothetical protein